MRAMDSCKNAWASNKNLSGKGVEYDFWGQQNYAQTDERRSNETTPTPWDPLKHPGWPSPSETTEVRIEHWIWQHELSGVFLYIGIPKFRLNNKLTTNTATSSLVIHNKLQGIV